MIGCASRGVVAVIDPQSDIRPYLGIAERHRLSISHIIETHVQADHHSGAYELSQETSASVYFHKDAPVLFPHEKLNDRDEVNIGNRVLQVLYTPGHTDDSISIYVDGWFVLTGDTLFVNDVGRVDLSLEDQDITEVNARAENLFESIHSTLMVLPDYTEIYPGHFGGSSCGKHMDGKPVSTIGREKLTNPMLQIKSREEFVAMLTKNTPPAPQDFRTIKVDNLGKESE
jgi:hydroxyacylglutathione hydrolase